MESNHDLPLGMDNHLLAVIANKKCKRCFLAVLPLNYTGNYFFSSFSACFLTSILKMYAIKPYSTYISAVAIRNIDILYP